MSALGFCGKCSQYGELATIRPRICRRCMGSAVQNRKFSDSDLHGAFSVLVAVCLAIVAAYSIAIILARFM